MSKARTIADEALKAALRLLAKQPEPRGDIPAPADTDAETLRLAQESGIRLRIDLDGVEG